MATIKRCGGIPTKATTPKAKPTKRLSGGTTKDGKYVVNYGTATGASRGNNSYYTREYKVIGKVEEPKTPSPKPTPKPTSKATTTKKSNPKSNNDNVYATYTLEDRFTKDGKRHVTERGVLRNNGGTSVRSKR